ncbi:MAG: hypothetical protein IJ689_07415 [Alphaproteobacteria bacterium]|nr:hypothetical protein [Alphaproteobacteria bacterium]
MKKFLAFVAMAACFGAFQAKADNIGNIIKTENEEAAPLDTEALERAKALRAEIEAKVEKAKEESKAELNAKLESIQNEASRQKAELEDSLENVKALENDAINEATEAKENINAKIKALDEAQDSLNNLKDALAK